MTAPPVQYTKTSDGYSIAYASTGSGPAIVFLPQLFQHSQRLWAGGPYAATLSYLARRFRVVQYDSRGQGMSQRDLPDDHDGHAYVRDLEAVMDAAGLQTAVLHGNSYFGWTALHFAARHPERVSGLVLHEVAVDGSTFMASQDMRVLAEHDWEAFLLVAARTVFPGRDTQRLREYFRGAADQADHLKLLNTAEGTEVSGMVRGIKVPVLLISSGSDPAFGQLADRKQQLAQLITGSRLINTDQPYARQGEGTFMAIQTEAFLDEVASRWLDETPDGLSPREVEVLRLVAAGKNNPQIAEALVISPNTVQRHVSNILAKTGLANRIEAATYATRHGLD